MTKSPGLRRCPDNGYEGQSDVVIQAQNSTKTQNRGNPANRKPLS